MSNNKFISPVIGIPDVGNPTPQSYHVLPPQKEWPDLFVKQMKYLIEEAKVQEQGENKDNGEDEDDNGKDEDDGDNEE